ncbi:unnamed protein product [Allacma fusca]|uniref:Uncharacterized protein n=1 Tax=Allacma fusca TaxID=39272 RepID=A0A8J2JSN0_9HEXA|nr:unnamed protein product [Allacma fusca]
MEAEARVKAISEIIQKCFYFGIFPFTWNELGKSVQITESKRKVFQWVVNLVLFGFYVSFQIARYTWTAYGQRSSEKSQTDFQSFISGIFMSCFFYLETIRNMRYFPTVVNRLIRLSSALTRGKIFTGNESSVVSKVSKRGIRTIKNCSRLIQGMIVVYTLRLIARPEKPFHLTSFLLEFDSLKGWKVVCMLFQVYIWIVQFMPIIIFCTLHFHHTSTVQEYLSIMHRNPGTSDKLSYFPKCYSTLRVAQIQWNHYLGRYYTYYIVVIVTTLILNVYEAVTAHTAKALFAAVIMGYQQSDAFWEPSRSSFVKEVRILDYCI